MTNYERTAAWLAACGKQPGDARTVAVQLAAARLDKAEGQ